MKKTFIYIFLLINLFVYSQDLTGLIKDPDLYYGQLENGLTYMLKENKYPEDRLYLYLVVKAGALHELSNQNGMAHFLEHLAYNGSTHFKSGEIDIYLKSIGAPAGSHSNAYTSLEKTVYKLIIPTDEETTIDKGFSILSDIASEISFLPEEIEKERGVILEEMRQRKGLGERISETRRNLLYSGTKLIEHKIIGKEEQIKTFNQQDFFKFYQKWYQPNNMALVMAGDIKKDQAKFYLDKYFSKLDKGKIINSDLEMALPKISSKSAFHHDQELDLGVLQLYFPTQKNRGQLEQWKLDAYFSILQKTFGMRIDEKMISGNTDYLDNEIYFFSEDYFDSDFSILSVQFQPEKFEVAMKVGLADFYQLLSQPTNQYELQNIKAEYFSELERILNEVDVTESAFFISKMLATYLNNLPFYDQAEYIKKLQKFYQEITVADIRQFIQQMLNIEDPAFFYILPHGFEGKIDHQKSLVLYKEAKNQKYEKFYYASQDKKIELPVTNVNAKEFIKKRKYHQKLDLIEFNFKNGIKLYYKKSDYEPDTVSLKAIQPQTITFLEKNKTGYVNFYLDNHLLGGTSQWSSSMINTFVSKENIDIGFRGNFYHFVYNMSSPINKFQTGLEVLKEILINNVFDENILNLLKEQKYASLAQYQKDPEYHLSLTIMKKIYGLEPLAKEDYQKIDIGFLERFRDQYIHLDKTNFMIVGNISEDEVIQQFGQIFGALEFERKELQLAKVQPIYQIKSKEKITLYKGIENKAKSQLFFPGITDKHKDFTALLVINNILNERLDQVIREENSKTYSIVVDLSQDSYAGFGHLTVTFHSDPDTIEATTALVIEQLAIARESGFTQKELDRAIISMTKPYEEYIGENNYWLGLLYYDLYDQPLDTTFKRLDKIGKMKLKKINRVIKNYFHPDQNLSVLLYPEKN
ncbi:MAG: insulinase family protein [Spirochaetes bacterium]|nr:insulinase family protein [Spirochaetota bacterium]